MTKADIIDAVKATKCCAALSKKDIEGVFNCAFDALAKGIKKDKRIAIPDFGVFTVRERKARMGRNPQTGATIKIKASKTVGFKPSPALKKGL